MTDSPFTSWDAAIERALQTPGRRLVTVYCKACRPDRKREIGVVTDSPSGPFFRAELPAPELKQFLADVKAQHQRKVVYPSVDVVALLGHPDPPPGRNTPRCRCPEHGDRDVDAVDLTRLAGQSKAARKVQYLSA